LPCILTIIKTSLPEHNLVINPTFIKLRRLLELKRFQPDKPILPKVWINSNLPFLLFIVKNRLVFVNLRIKKNKLVAINWPFLTQRNNLN